MTDERIRDLLHGVPVPEEQAARERAWRVVETDFGRRAHHPARRRIPRALLAVAAAVCAAAIALTPPGEAVGEWISDAVRPARAPSAPVLTSLPAPGRMLVTADGAAWVVQSDGSKRRLGSYDEAGWSPGGLFVVAARGRLLTALEPDGTVRWTVTPPSRNQVSRPAWSPDGFRIAYLSAGAVRVVAGDGTGDALLARGSSAVTPAWRPGTEHVLAHVAPLGQIVVTQTDTGERLWRARTARSPRQLLWSADGRRLVAVAPGAIEVFDSGGRSLGGRAMPEGTRAGVAAIHPYEHALALVRHSLLDGSSKVLRLDLDTGRPQELFAGRGEFSDVAWSPDAGWVLVGWRDADQWLFIRGARVGQIRAVSNLGRQFDPGGSGAAAFPRVSGWCCPR